MESKLDCLAKELDSLAGKLAALRKELPKGPGKRPPGRPMSGCKTYAVRLTVEERAIALAHPGGFSAGVRAGLALLGQQKAPPA